MVQQLPRQAQRLTRWPAGWVPRGNKATVPHFDGALTAREAVPYGYLKTEDTVASGVFLGLSRPAALILALHSSPPTVSVAPLLPSPALPTRTDPLRAHPTP